MTTPMHTAAPPPALPRQTLARTLCWGVLAAVLIASWKGADMRPLELLRDGASMASYAASFFPPDFHDWQTYLQEMLVTLQIAVWATTLAALCAIPCALLASSNIAPPWVCQPLRRLMEAARAIHEMVFAMLFVMAVGLGPFAGVLALFVTTTGTLSRLFSEAVEAIDPQPLERIRASGAHTFEQIISGVLPQVMPLWIACALHRFEANLRSATVVGMVGAGGIGVILWEVIRSFEYAQTCALLLMIVVALTLIDLASARLRKLFI